MQVIQEADQNFLTFEDVLKKYSHIRLATQADNEDILKFYKNEVMQTQKESVSFARDPDFFSFYRQTTNIFWTFLFLNDDLSIGGMGTVLRHIRYVEGEYKPVAYFCDLRISANAGRRAKVQWRQFFPDVIASLPKLNKDEVCFGSYTAILANNDVAINSLTKSGRGVTYRYLNTYNVQSFISTGLCHSKKFHCKPIDMKIFSDFYKKHAYHKFLSQELLDLEKTLTNIQKDSKGFLLLGVFKQDKIYAITALSVNNMARRLKINNLSGAKLIASKTFKFTLKQNIKDDGELSVSDLNYTCFHSDHKDPSTYYQEEMIEAVFDYLDKNKLTRESHILNIYLNQNSLANSILSRGISFLTQGHLYEIHTEGGQGVLPKDQFRFEGALL